MRELCGRYVFLSIAALIPTFALASDPPSVRVIECGAEIPVIKESTRLSPNCTYHQGVELTQSKVMLDCQGATLDGDDSVAIGIHISSNQQIFDVTVRNCQIRRFTKRGVRIASKYSDSKKLTLPLDQRYLASPTRVRLENIKIRGTGEVGIYIDDYVTDTVIRSSYIGGSGGAGIYLEHSSKRTHVVNSLIEQNGWGKNPSRAREKGREAVAIDSSAENIIENNRFRSNSAGGIFLYRNCQEKTSTNPDSVPRWQVSEGNVIRNNDFEDQPIGVWLASRQSMLMKTWDCGSRYYGDGKYVLDAAPRNTVTGNLFVKAVSGVVVEDDENAITNNTFREIQDSCIRIGTEARSHYLHRPVTGTTVLKNTCDAQIAFDHKYKILFGTLLSVDSSNH